jgi:hypothetical protein
VVTITPEFFARLFRGDRYRFEFGVRRGDARWFSPGTDQAVLAERRQWLRQTTIPTTHWMPAAEPVFAEAAELFPPAMRPAGPEGAEALAEFSAAWEPDFVLLRRQEDGEFRMVGGVLCFASSWTPERKLGLTVDQIHEPVPTLNANLGTRIRTFLSRLPADQIFERENWGLAATPERNLHPLRQQPRLSVEVSLDRVWLRVEHQAFRALPRSGGLLFIIHLTVHPLGEVLREPAVRDSFRQMLESMPASVAGYKGILPASGTLLRQLAE